MLGCRWGFVKVLRMVSDAGKHSDPTAPDAPPEGVRCDFCGEVVSRVRRIALDRGYDRLQTPHQVQYACPTCSERKEAERRSTAGS